MSSQAFSSISQTPTPFTAEERREPQQKSTDKSVCATHCSSTSLLDEPWKVTLLPAAPAQDEPQARRSLPWRMGDVTRLKDDSPEGMMKYIATHTTGWWQEMAERALRDTEKARRMAEEQGWQPGQYWSLEVDAEAREKVLAAEEARRVREAEERAKEEAEKEAFAKRQLELLEKAGWAPRCEYQYTDGRGCKAPQVRGERWCHGHAKMMSYRPEKLEILPMEDAQAVMVNLYRVTKSLLSGRITEKVAGLTLWSIAIGAPSAGRVRKTHRGGAETRRKTRKHSPQMNTEKHRSEQLHPGVTDGKSFVSGVSTLGTPVVKNWQHGENSLNRHGHEGHSRDLSTPPHVANASSESLKMTTGREYRQSSEHGNVSTAEVHSSVSPCLRGESEFSASPRLRGEVKVGQSQEIASIGGRE